MGSSVPFERSLKEDMVGYGPRKASGKSVEESLQV